MTRRERLLQGTRCFLTAAGIGIAATAWGQCTCYTTDTFGNRQYYDCKTGVPCSSSGTTSTTLTPVASSNGTSFLTAQVDNPNVIADGMHTTTVRVQAWYQNTSGLSYPAGGAFVWIHGAYGGDYSGFADSGGNANFTWHTVDSGSYGITAHWGSLTTSVQVSPVEPTGSWINMSLPASGVMYSCSLFSGNVPFAWQWHSAKYGDCCYRLELLHSVSANNNPGWSTYNKMILTAHYSNNRDDTQQYSTSPCQFGAANFTWVDLYYYHQVGSWMSYAFLTTSNMQSFYTN